jgi:hypothetical protein
VAKFCTGIYFVLHCLATWSATNYSRIHFLPFTRDGRGYAQQTPFKQSLDTYQLLLRFAFSLFAYRSEVKGVRSDFLQLYSTTHENLKSAAKVGLSVSVNALSLPC